MFVILLSIIKQDALILEATSHIWTMRLKKGWFQVYGALAKRGPLGPMGQFLSCSLQCSLLSPVLGGSTGKDIF